jgi:hypothetical protein
VKPPQPGRNDPCWCGSKKKFKRCHLPLLKTFLFDHPYLPELLDTKAYDLEHATRTFRFYWETKVIKALVEAHREKATPDSVPDDLPLFEDGQVELAADYHRRVRRPPSTSSP